MSALPDVTTEAEFDAALTELLLKAGRNGVDPCGSWVTRHDGSLPDWEVVVVELEDQSD